MKKTLTIKFETDPDNPGEDTDFKATVCAKNLAACVWEIKEKLRNIEKHGEKPFSQQDFFDILEDNQIDIDFIYG